MATVSLRRVVKRFGDAEVVHGVDLDIADTEFLVLVGPSGCGKSTLLRMVAGLEDVSSGEILIDGRTVNEVAPKDRDIAMVFQDYALYPHLNVYRNMSFALEVQGRPREAIRAQVERAAGILGIGALFPMVHRLGLAGAAINTFLTECIIVISMALYLLRQGFFSVGAKQESA